MRPTADWQETSPEIAALLHDHGVRMKRSWDRERCDYIYRVPTWARTFYLNHLRRCDKNWRGLLRRALRRAARDPEFRAAFEAAATVGLEREFLKAQEHKLDD